MSVSERLIARSLTEVAVVNTTTDTDLLSVSLSGALAGDVYRLRAFGKRLNNTGSAVTARMRLYLGATTLLDTNTVSFTAGANIGRWLADVRIYVPTLTSQIAEGTAYHGTTASATWGGISGTAGQGYNTATEDLSTAKTLRLAVALGTADALADYRLEGYSLYRERG